METIYHVVKERKVGEEVGRVVASFSTSREAEEEISRIQSEDQDAEYNYFVQTARTMP